jgi:hypothetical protein
MTGRQPTIDEAVENILRPTNTKEFQLRSIAFYRENYGNAFADTVRNLALAEYKKRKNKK